MSKLYKIVPKLKFIFYILLLYHIWHLCQYGGMRSHLLKIGILFVVLLITICIEYIKRKRQSTEKLNLKQRLLKLETIVFLVVTLIFGCGVIYSAIPYHGALSWRVERWFHKKEIRLTHNNIFDTGIEGVLMDLDDALNLPEKLYISNRFQVSFDENGIIQSLSTFLYGKVDNKERTYLVDYDGEDMIVWLDGNANADYDEDMILSPMIDMMNQTDWVTQCKVWLNRFDESLTYEFLYMGKRGFQTPEGLQYVPGDANGDGVDSGAINFYQLNNGGEVVGYELSLHIPAVESVTPVRYMMEPEYISQRQLNQDNDVQQSEKAQNANHWTVDQSNGAVYYFLDNDIGWRLEVTDAAAGSRFYELEKSTDGGNMWEVINNNPYLNDIGVASGLMFYDENIGIIGMSNAGGDGSALYVTNDGGISFKKVEVPKDDITQLPEMATEYGYTKEQYDYLHIPTIENNVLMMIVSLSSAENDGIIFTSIDNGNTWEYNGVKNES